MQEYDKTDLSEASKDMKQQHSVTFIRKCKELRFQNIGGNSKILLVVGILRTLDEFILVKEN